MTASKSTSRREERKQKLRQEILASASSLFALRGYENVTLRAIAEDIGYSHATIYQYFPDKSHLLSELCQETFAMLVAEFDRIAEKDLKPKERLFETTRGMVRFFLSHPQYVRIVFFGPEDRNGIRAGEYIGEIGRPLFDRFVEAFKRSMRESRIKVADPVVAAHSWWCAVLGLSMVLIIQGDIPDFSPHQDIIEHTLRTMWAGLSGERATPRARVLKATA